MSLTRLWNVETKWRSILFSLAIVATPAALRAQQGTITGRIVATGTNEPLADVRVMLAATSLQTTSGADGRYTLRNVPPGNVDVRAIRVGYQEQK